MFFLGLLFASHKVIRVQWIHKWEQNTALQVRIMGKLPDCGGTWNGYWSVGRIWTGWMKQRAFQTVHRAFLIGLALTAVPPSPLPFFPFFILIDFIFQRFRFKGKMNGRYRYFLCAVSPHICTAPPPSTSSPTMVHSWWTYTDMSKTPRVRIYLRVHLWCVHAMGLDVYLWWHTLWFSGSTVVKNPSANAGDARDVSSISGSGRPPGVGHGNPLQYSCLGNSTDRGAWKDYSPWVTKSWTQLSDWA